MKKLYLRSGVLLACALGLASCGGGSGSLQLGGTVYGVTRDGLTLQNNGGTPLVIGAAGGSFVFPDLVAPDSKYHVTVATPPAAATCVVTGGDGTMGAYSVGTVGVYCSTFRYDLGGTITGLGAANTGLVLINGSDRQTIAAGATTFNMTLVDAAGKQIIDQFTGKPAGQVPDSSPYGITVLTQPAGKTCSVVNGVGVMGSAAITNVQVNCI
jgi:hypothetical protein